MSKSSKKEKKSKSTEKTPKNDDVTLEELPHGIMYPKLKFIFDTKIKPDVNLIVGKQGIQESFVAHRNILEGESLVFQKLFERIDRMDWDIPKPVFEDSSKSPNIIKGKDKVVKEKGSKEKSEGSSKKKSASPEKIKENSPKSSPSRNKKEKTSDKKSGKKLCDGPIERPPEVIGDEVTEDKTIIIQDIFPKAFLILLRYLYLDEICFENYLEAIWTARAATKYCIPVLYRVAIEHLERAANLSNVWDTLSAAYSLHEDFLREICLRYIVLHTHAALAQAEFLKTTRMIIQLILEQETLNISEFELYDRIMAWAEVQLDKAAIPINGPNQRTILSEKLFRLIRFPTMTVEEFAVCIADNDVLLIEDRIAIMRYFISGKKFIDKYSYVRRKRPDLDDESLVCSEMTELSFVHTGGYLERSESYENIKNPCICNQVPINERERIRLQRVYSLDTNLDWILMNPNLLKLKT